MTSRRVTGSYPAAVRIPPEPSRIGAAAMPAKGRSFRTSSTCNHCLATRSGSVTARSFPSLSAATGVQASWASWITRSTVAALTIGNPSGSRLIEIGPEPTRSNSRGDRSSSTPSSVAVAAILWFRITSSGRRCAGAGRSGGRTSVASNSSCASTISHCGST